MEPLATSYPIGDSVTMASHFLYGIPFPLASTSTHPNHGRTLCSDGLILGGLVFDHVMEVWDPPDTINLGMMCSARVTSRSHCTEFTSFGMEGVRKTTISDDVDELSGIYSSNSKGKQPVHVISGPRHIWEEV